MKTSVFFILALTSMSAVAQKVVLREGSQKFSTGSQNAISTTIYGSSKNDVQNKWKSTLKNFKNEKVKSDKHEMFGDNVLITDFGNNPVDIYTTFEENKKEMTVEMHVAFDLGGAYLKSSEQRDKYSIAEKIVKDFAVKTTKDVLMVNVKDAEKVQGKLENDQKGLEKENKGLQSDAASNQDKITAAQRDIITKNADLAKKKTEIEVQEKVVGASTGAVSEQAKSSQKIHEKLLKQEKSLQKDVEKLNSNIDSYNAKIKKAQGGIKKNEAEQEKKKQAIDAQKKVVDDAKAALNKVD